MSFFSVADCCRHLGIDPKTLRRWLAQAQLSLSPHPTDARKQGLGELALREVARQHQRDLPALPHSPLERPPDAVVSWPSALLALPAHLEAVQHQMAALQEQVMALTQALANHPVPTHPGPATRQRTPRPRSTSRSTGVAPVKPPRQPVHVIPRVEWDGAGHYVVICPKKGRLPLEPDTPEWFDWLRTQSSFRFVGKEGTFSAHHEWRVPSGAWRAHRHLRNHGYHLRLAPTQQLTSAVLEQAAAALQAHLK